MKIRLLPRYSDLCFIIFFLLVMASGAQMLSEDSDPGRHLTLGSFILDNGIVPTHDLFSHTRTGQARPPYEWLSQVLFTLTYRLLNLDGVIFFTAALIGITILVVYNQSNQRSQSPIVALFITFIAGSAMSIHWLPRPHIITFLLLALWVEGLERLARGTQVNLYLFPLGMLFWANAHGGFIYGFLVWGAYAAGWVWDAWRRNADRQSGEKIFLVGAISAAASVITPDFWHNWDAVLNNRSAFILSRTVETRPPDFSNSSSFSFILLLGLITLFLLINRWKISARHAFLLFGFGLMSVLMARNIPLFAIACAPILSELISRNLGQLKPWKNIEDLFARFTIQAPKPLIPLCVVLATLGYLTWNHLNHKPIYQFNPQVFPVQATDWIEANSTMDGQMFNEFDWGGYLLYRLWPQHLVFLDSQSDFYGEPLMREYDRVMTVDQGWQNVLDKYRIEWAIVRVDSEIVKALEASHWIILYQDKIAIILRRL